jgi:stage V sporulation protein R
MMTMMTRRTPAMSDYLWTDSEWSFLKLDRVYKAIEQIAIEELGLNPYPNQIEIITSEQMVDAYASIGLPIFYHHWSFGKHFTQNWNNYQKGMQGLAYEIVINSNPCISYLMEENTMTMQALVISHAAFGHSHFFRNNALFKEWTDAESIIDYLIFARDYIAKCEVREGKDHVESFLDSCHALMNYGINRYKRPSKLSALKERARAEERENYKQSQVSDLFDTLVKQAKIDPDAVKPFPAQPEENILYFCEKYAPDLPEWKREIIRIVRKISEYFFPQGLTKSMNEGCATYCHYRIMNRLHEKGLMTDGAMIEFMTSHTNVVFQPEFDDPRYSGINPYALGFAMMQDIERICNTPTEEDRRWFPEIAGGGDEMTVLRDAWANYRDESFVRQFLSPKVIRDFGLFRIADHKGEPHYVVTAIHDDRGYEQVRESLADSYERHASVPQIEVLRVDPQTRVLTLKYWRYRDRTLGKTAVLVKHLQALWGHVVTLRDEADNLIA